MKLPCPLGASATGLLLSLALLSGCSDSPNVSETPVQPVVDAATPSDGDAAVSKYTVKVNNFTYSPETLTVPVGATVQWIFVEGTHSVTSGNACTKDARFDSGQKMVAARYEHTFEQEGTFPYFCDYREHCTKFAQEGVIVVVAKEE